MLKLIDVLDFGIKELSGYSLDPRFESFVFLEKTTGKTRVEILINEEGIKEEELSVFKGFLKRRIKGEPWQYIVGKTNFIGFDILTEKGVFIPRPETEFMASVAIERLKNFNTPYILEIGCGTGAISIAIACNIKEAKIIATDISEEAINLCKKNIDYHNLGSRINIIRTDLLNSFHSSEIFDMIISNPPYVSVENLKKLDLVVKNEPELAIDGGLGGVSLVNKILAGSVARLKSRGFVFIEIDDSNIPYLEIPSSISYSIVNDQYGRKRILKATKV